MGDEPQEKLKSQFALAVAQGVSVAAWARSNGVPRGTAFNWANDPAVRKMVEACRRRTIDRAVGQMKKNRNWAVEGIIKIAKDAECDDVRLRALRYLYKNMIDMPDKPTKRHSPRL
jgi:hypothetical protein